VCVYIYIYIYRYIYIFIYNTPYPNPPPQARVEAHAQWNATKAKYLRLFDDLTKCGDEPDVCQFPVRRGLDGELREAPPAGTVAWKDRVEALER